MYCHDTSVPRRLLRGPWTEDKINLLDHMLSSLIPLATEDQAITEMGLEDSIRQNNSRIVMLLTDGSSVKRMPTGSVNLVEKYTKAVRQGKGPHASC